jgi:hypothetical protein
MQTSVGTYSSQGASIAYNKNTSNKSPTMNSLREAEALEQLARAQEQLLEAHKVTYAEKLTGVSKEVSFARAQQNEMMRMLTKAELAEYKRQQAIEQEAFARQQAAEQQHLREQYLTGKVVLTTPWAELAFPIVKPAEYTIVDGRKKVTQEPRVQVPLINEKVITVCLGWVKLCLTFDPKKRTRAPCQRYGYCDHQDEDHSKVICSAQLKTGHCPHSSRGSCKYNIVDFTKCVIPTHFTTSAEGNVVKSAMSQPIESSISVPAQIDRWICDAYTQTYLEELSKNCDADLEEFEKMVKQAEEMIKKAYRMDNADNVEEADKIYEEAIELLSISDFKDYLWASYSHDKKCLLRVSEKRIKEAQTQLTRIVQGISHLIIDNAKTIKSSRFVAAASGQTQGVLSRLEKSQCLQKGFGENKQLLFELFLAFQQDKGIQKISRALGCGLVDPHRPRVNALAKELARRLVICRSEFFITLEKRCGFDVDKDNSCKWSNSTCRNSHPTAYMQCDKTEEKNRVIVAKGVKAVQNLLDPKFHLTSAWRKYLKEYQTTTEHSNSAHSLMMDVYMATRNPHKTKVTFETVRYTPEFVAILEKVQTECKEKARKYFNDFKQIALFNPSIICTASGILSYKKLPFSGLLPFQPVLTDIINSDVAFKPPFAKEEKEVTKKVKQVKVKVEKPAPKSVEPIRKDKKESPETLEYDRLVSKVAQARTAHNSFASEAREIKETYINAKEEEMEADQLAGLRSELKDAKEFLKELRGDFDKAQAALTEWQAAHPEFMQQLDDEEQKRKQERIKRLTTQAQRAAHEIATKELAKFELDNNVILTFEEGYGHGVSKDDNDSDVIFEKLYQKAYRHQLSLAGL